MATTTVDVRKVNRELTDRYPGYTFTYSLFGVNTEHAVGIASDGLFHYFLTDVGNAGYGGFILKVDPSTGEEVARDSWTSAAANKIAYDICLRRGRGKPWNTHRHGLEGYLLWDNAGTMTISKMTLLGREASATFAIEIETFTTTVNTTARGLCLRGPYLHVTHNNSSFAIYHDVYDIRTGDRLLQNQLVNEINGPADKAGIIYDGLYFVHHPEPIKAFGFPNSRYRVNVADPDVSLGGYAGIRQVDLGTDHDGSRHSITWDRYFIWEMASNIA